MHSRARLGEQSSFVIIFYRPASLQCQQLLDCDAVEGVSAGLGAPPPTALPLGQPPLGSGAAARPAGKASPQEASS